MEESKDSWITSKSNTRPLGGSATALENNVCALISKRLQPSSATKSSVPCAHLRNVPPSLLDLDGAVDVAILNTTAPNDHSFGGLLLVLSREVFEIVDLTLEMENLEHQ